MGENLVHAFEAVACASERDTLHLNMHAQALMLAGMSIEVMLKAILVNVPEVRIVVTAPKQSCDAKGKSLHSVFYRHNLVEIAREAKVDLNHERLRTAAALKEYIYWRGRYVAPTEKGIDDFIPVVLDNTLLGQPHLNVTIEAVRDLIDHVIAEVKARLYNQV
ncbi:MAG: hypothetical protein ABSG48_03065 [Geobacteraceae bacterium]